MDDKFEELYNESMELLDYMLTLPGSSTASEVALFNSRMRYIDSIIHEMKVLNKSTEA